jgi:hypothetical protein
MNSLYYFPGYSVVDSVAWFAVWFEREMLLATLYLLFPVLTEERLTVRMTRKIAFDVG